ncbi:MAG TPA: peptidoglycan DD-metalloendopeptidase family protein [Desulfomonilaceae bacterium]|nr:peptidoglycan DD-metalloendopeptidase family protein [Desulfomonilaceae bacterium]
MRRLQPNVVKIGRFVAILAVSIIAAGCPHVNSGMPPGLQMPLLQHKKPASGVYHVIGRDESLWNIAKTYGVDLQLLAEVNNLKPPYSLKPNEKVFIPGADRIRRAEQPPGPAMEEPAVEDFSGALAWPVKGKIISEFGVLGGTQFNGISIQAQESTPVKAAASGRVGYVGSIPLYGNMIILEHPNRMVTVYGHLKEIRVQNGSKVNRGDIIGTVGMSGRSGTPALYFEVRSRSKPRNPIFFLDQKS